MPSFEIVGYVLQILGSGAFPTPLYVSNPKKPILNRVNISIENFNLEQNHVPGIKFVQYAQGWWKMILWSASPKKLANIPFFIQFITAYCEDFKNL